MIKFFTKKHLLILTISIFVVIIGISICLFFEKANINKNYNADLNKFVSENISLNSNYVDFISEEAFGAEGHISVIPKYTSDISVAYKNKDGTNTLYVFASPIKYYDLNGKLTTIDTRISNITDEQLGADYAYETAKSDIISLYPKLLSKGITIYGANSYSFGINTKNTIYPQYGETVNFIGATKNIITYDKAFSENTSLNVYPSRLGTCAEIQIDSPSSFNELSFWLDSNGAKCEKNEMGYIVLTKRMLDEEGTKLMQTIGIIQAPLLKDSNGNISYSNNVSIKRKISGKYQLTFQLDETFLKNPDIQYPLTCYLSFELKRDNQPDSAVYSSKPDLNTYLSHYSVIGKSHELGEGQLRIRFFMTQNNPLEINDIQKASFNIWNISTVNNLRLEMISLQEDWCSLTGNWNSPVKQGNQASYINSSSPHITFDITEEVKKWYADESGMAENNGVLMKMCEGEGLVYGLLTSNDSALFNNYTEVVF